MWTIFFTQLRVLPNSFVHCLLWGDFGYFCIIHLIPLLVYIVEADVVVISFSAPVHKVWKSFRQIMASFFIANQFSFYNKCKKKLLFSTNAVYIMYTNWYSHLITSRV